MNVYIYYIYIQTWLNKSLTFTRKLDKLIRKRAGIKLSVKFSVKFSVLSNQVCINGKLFQRYIYIYIYINERRLIYSSVSCLSS